MLTIHVWPKRLKEFLLTHPLYKSPTALGVCDRHETDERPRLSRAEGHSRPRASSSASSSPR
jgi:hypothetical protein